jgi:hypothetical protein
MGITTDLESDLIEGMLCCDLVQINSIPNQNGTFLDLTFSKLVRTLRLRSANRPFLDSIVKIRAYELLVDVRLCKFEATSNGVDLCVYPLYDVTWSCFEKFMQKNSTRCAQKLPWVTKELNGLKNRTTKAAKKMKESERRCMVDDDISECDWERLRGDFTSLRSSYQEHPALACKVRHRLLLDKIPGRFYCSWKNVSGAS